MSRVLVTCWLVRPHCTSDKYAEMVEQWMAEKSQSNVKQVWKCMHSVTILQHLAENDLWRLWIAPLMSVFFWGQWLTYGHGVWHLSSWVISSRRIPPHGCMAGWEFSTWGFPTLSLPWAGIHATYHVKWELLLSNFNQNWNMLNFSRTPKYQIL
jgi:hypothetical protein